MGIDILSKSITSWVCRAEDQHCWSNLFRYTAFRLSNGCRHGGGTWGAADDEKTFLVHLLLLLVFLHGLAPVAWMSDRAVRAQSNPKFI